MIEAIFAAVIALGVTGGHDMKTAAEHRADCQADGYATAVYVDGSGFDYECQ